MIKASPVILAPADAHDVRVEVHRHNVVVFQPRFKPTWSPVVDNHHKPGKREAPFVHWNERTGSASSSRAVTQAASGSRPRHGPRLPSGNPPRANNNDTGRNGPDSVRQG
jgi:hypothetical protein